MEPESVEKQMSSTNRKDKIFNVRRIHYKQFDHQQYFKPHFSPNLKKEHDVEIPSQKWSKKGGQYNFQVAIISSAAYKEVNRKYAQLKEEQALEKQKKLSELRAKDQQLEKYRCQKERIDNERQKLLVKKQELLSKIQEIRTRNQALKAEQNQRNEEYRFLNMQYLREMIMSMRYQNGLDIDPDRMTYEELLQLEEQMGSVSKGFTQEMINQMPKIVFNSSHKPQLCSICYQDIKYEQTINKLECEHTYHVDCIKVWLLKERVCPMCKQQIQINRQ